MWLFCWAKTGNGSIKTANEVKSVFNMIIPFNYEALNKKMSHDWAQIMRYSPKNIENALENIAGQV